MKQQHDIIIAQTWNLGLAQEIGRGIVEYARHQPRLRIYFINLPGVLDQIEGWHKLAGIILAVHPEDSPPERLRRLQVPLVSLGWHPEESDIPQVDFDPRETGRMAGEHLLVDSGCRQLACLFKQRKTSFEQVRGVSDFCEERGIPLSVFEATGADPHSIPPSFNKWVQNVSRPAAVFCSNDNLGREAIHLIQSEGLHVPDDIGVLGCGDDVLRCEQTIPALSSVHLPYRKIGTEAIRLLDALLKGRSPRRRHIYLPPESVSMRMSTSLYATGDPSLRKALEFIRRHAFEPIRMEAVARHAGLSLRTLQHRFRAEVGHSPVEELRRTRMNKVRDLLRHSSLTLDEIAEVVGYESGHYLSSAFKAFAGESARGYRNRFLPITHLD